jgi:hypothetical protein
MTDPHHQPSDAEPFRPGLRWAIKLSFVEYVMRSADGQGTASAGATPAGNGEMVFEPVPGPGPVEADRFWAFRGDVRFGAHFGMLFVRIADPWISVRGELAELTVVDPYNRQDQPRLRLVSFTLVPDPSSSGLSSSGLEVWSGSDVRLTPEGTELFNDVYPPGEPFEPLTITVPSNAATGTALSALKNLAP